MEHRTGGHIGNRSCRKIHRNHIAGLDGVARFGTLQDGKTDVDRVAVENSGEGAGDDAADAALLDGDRGVLAAGAAPEVPVGHHDVALLHLLDEVLVEILHAVLGKFLVIRSIEISGGDDDIGVDIVPVSENSSLYLHLMPP